MRQNYYLFIGNKLQYTFQVAMNLEGEQLVLERVQFK